MIIKTRFTPIRMIVGQKDPVTLDVVLKNNSTEEVLSTVIVKLPSGLGFDLSGITREKRQRIDYVKPNEDKTVSFRIYPRHNVEEGQYPVTVSILTHPGRYDKTDSTKQQEAILRVLK